MSRSGLDVSLVPVVLAVYASAALAYGLLWSSRFRLAKIPATVLMSVGLGLNLFQIVYRWVTIEQPPFKTLYESLLLLAVCIAIVYLVIEGVYRLRILGLPSALGAGATVLYAFLQVEKEAVNLPAALQSGWFIPHVVVYFFGYAALFVGTAAAAIYLLRPAPIRLGRRDLTGSREIDVEGFMSSSVRFGFVLLTTGLLMGAFWAKAAWGDYWVWDPKETWSLVTWLVYAAYLHLRFMSGWKGRKLAVVAIVGFAAVMFTYLGMNVLPTAESSLHVYQ
ncbi:MAG: c-type cytochrome biogenesis protein CcsB [Deltaproteobacteria bacterium]|nr:c-type cytochrome biogenesis protein CcsB [Deltaproteobacteria bacterium]